MLPKFLENIVILCFESRFSEQNSVIRLKSNIFAHPQISGLATPLVVRAFYFTLRCLGNFKTSGRVVGRLACAPATTRLTPQLVGISVEL